MAHEILEHDNLALSGETAWHGLGTVVPAGTLTVANALQIAGLDWEVTKEPQVRNGKVIPGLFWTVRSDIDLVLGSVKAKYRVFNNRSALEFGDALISGGVPVETAGSLRNCKEVFITFELPFKSSMLPDGARRHFLFVSNSHDGSSAIKAQLTTVRVVCKNTYGYANAEALKLKTSFSVRHTESAEARLAEAQRVLGLAERAADVAESLEVELFKKAMARSEFKAFLDKLVEVPDELGRSRTMALKVQDAITSRYNREDEAIICGTALGAFQAVTAYDSHDAGGRTTATGSLQENRLARILDGGLSGKALVLLAS